MSVLDKFLNVLGFNSDDEDDFFNDDYYDDDDDYVEEKPIKKSRKEKEPVNDFYEEERTPFSVKEKTVKTTPKVTPMRSTRKQGNGMEVCVIKPTSFEDSREISDTLLLNRTIVLNVEGLDLEIAQRIIDFTSGACYAINGKLQKISNYIFIITPPNVDLSGDFQNIMDAFDTGSIKTDY